jgi:hypothetical protein
MIIYLPLLMTKAMLTRAFRSSGASYEVVIRCFIWPEFTITDSKAVISHAGIFNTQSMYGTTIFFTHYDSGGAYWKMRIKLLKKPIMNQSINY